MTSFTGYWLTLLDEPIGGTSRPLSGGQLRVRLLVRPSRPFGHRFVRRWSGRAARSSAAATANAAGYPAVAATMPMPIAPPPQPRSYAAFQAALTAPYWLAETRASMVFSVAA
jgi:hypothetical protein